MRKVQFIPKVVFDRLFPNDKIVKAERVEPDPIDRFCIDCKWCKWMDHAHYCYHPKIMKPGTLDLVTGQTLGAEPRVCSAMREIERRKDQHPEICGPNGHYWEPKEDTS